MELKDAQGNVYERVIAREFATHKLNEQGLEKAIQIGEAFDNLLLVLNTVCVEGREFAITKTKLEEACFFAKKAMAIGLENQQH